MLNWCNLSDADFTITTTYWDSSIDMSTYYDEDDYRSGYTIYWVGEGSGGDNQAYTSNRFITDDWWCAELRINRAKVSPSASGVNGVSAIMAHEIGHAFGFKENNVEPESIMCQMAHNRTAAKPHARDKDALDASY